MSLSELKAYVEELKKDEKNSHGYRAAASFMMLEHVDQMILRYQKEKQTETGAILLNVFGILQGLFVAIDALYDLAIGLTQYKYHININANPVLHELKYIRNDIVGHPTHRTYPNGGTGFSMLSHEDLSVDKLTYKTYIYSKNQLDIKTKEVLFKPLFDAYQTEKIHILTDIHKFISHEDTKTDIPEKIYVFYETLNLDALYDIKNAFMKEYHLEADSSNRFMWRVGLLEKLINWTEEDKELKQIITYMAKVQASKLYEIALDLEKRTGQDLYTPIPELLSSFYKFIRKVEKDALPLLKNLRDFTHPLYEKDIEALLELNPNKNATKLIHFLKEEKNPDKAYLLGSMLRAYRPKS